jgi:hypothetical protein
MLDSSKDLKDFFGQIGININKNENK